MSDRDERTGDGSRDALRESRSRQDPSTITIGGERSRRAVINQKRVGWTGSPRSHCRGGERALAVCVVEERVLMYIVARLRTLRLWPEEAEVIKLNLFRKVT